MFESVHAVDRGGIRGLWQRLRPGAFALGLSKLLESLRFADGQGQLWPLRVLTPDEKLSKPLKSAGCAVVVEAVPTSQGADALCLWLHDEHTISGLEAQLACVRSGGLVILCSRPGQLPRHRLTAAFLHAGLSEVVQLDAGRYLLTAGQVQPRY
ncbi:MAG: hypothetical protein JNM40_06545 [Myxococcales bacterium]|nr:hypothetical protein [Myxococcales bacterium]